MSNDRYEYSRSQLVFGNLAIFLWILLATAALWFYQPVASWAFLLISLGTIYVLLRRIGCNTCAYCKSCTMGFGRLSAWFFGKRRTKDLNNKTGLAFVILIYCFLDQNYL